MKIHVCMEGTEFFHSGRSDAVGHTPLYAMTVQILKPLIPGFPMMVRDPKLRNIHQQTSYRIPRYAAPHYM